MGGYESNEDYTYVRGRGKLSLHICSYNFNFSNGNLQNLEHKKHVPNIFLNIFELPILIVVFHASGTSCCNVKLVFMRHLRKHQI